MFNLEAFAEADASTGPFVQAAFICESVIENGDGSRTIQRAASEITVPRLPYAVQPKFYLCLIAGIGPIPAFEVFFERPGVGVVSLVTVQAPSGPRVEGRPFHWLIPVPLAIETYGLHWISVVAGDTRLLARTPLHVHPESRQPGKGD